jgi:hypothetical protein
VEHLPAPAPCFAAGFGGMTAVMPTIFRFAMISAVVAGICYAALFALASWLEPAPREIVVTVPPSRYAK